MQGPLDPQQVAGEDQEHDPGTPVADEKAEKRVGRVMTAREMLDYLRQAAAKKMEKVSKTDGTKSSHGAKSKCSQAKNKKSNLNNKKKVSTNQNWGQGSSLELSRRTPGHIIGAGGSQGSEKSNKEGVQGGSESQKSLDTSARNISGVTHSEEEVREKGAESAECNRGYLHMNGHRKY